MHRYVAETSSISNSKLDQILEGSTKGTKTPTRSCQKKPNSRAFDIHHHVYAPQNGNKRSGSLQRCPTEAGQILHVKGGSLPGVLDNLPKHTGLTCIMPRSHEATNCRGLPQTTGVLVVACIHVYPARALAYYYTLPASGPSGLLHDNLHPCLTCLRHPQHQLHVRWVMRIDTEPFQLGFGLR